VVYRCSIPRTYRQATRDEPTSSFRQQFVEPIRVQSRPAGRKVVHRQPERLESLAVRFFTGDQIAPVQRFVDEARIEYENDLVPRLAFIGEDVLKNAEQYNVVQLDVELLEHLTTDRVGSALADDTNAWILNPDGEWMRVTPEKPAKAHSHYETMMRRSLKRARRGARDRRAG